MLLKKAFIVAINERQSDVVVFKPGTIVVNNDIQPSMKIVRKDDVIDNKTGYKRLHLYLFVDEDADTGDYILGETDNIVSQLKKPALNVKRLVATTNTEIPIARLSKLFLNTYVENDGVDSVLIEYEKFLDKLIPCKNKHNVIRMSSFKENYNGEEVAEKIMSLIDEVYGNRDKDTVLEWIENNI